MGSGPSLFVTVRIALRLDDDLGRRVRMCLLDEPDVEVGLLVEDPGDGSVHTVSSLEGWDALVVNSVSTASRAAVDQAVRQRIPVVSGADLPAGRRPEGGTITAGVMTGSGLAAALAASMAASHAPPMETRLAWTVPGAPLAAGIPVTFPEPVGTLWAGRAEHRLPWPSVIGLAAPHRSQWRGAAVRLQVRNGEKGGQVRGIVDDDAFLDAVCMAAAALAAARGAYPPGVNGPGDPGGLFMRLAERAGMEAAAFVPG